MVLCCSGVSGFDQLGYYKQVQAAARPSNASTDPNFMFWIKSAANPLIREAPPQGTFAQFRDPTTAWKQVGQAGVLGAAEPPLDDRAAPVFALIPAASMLLV